ncbi:hypothetical protein [Novosphingobium sp. JCM 18896]|uniref:hypothetical protein n=1 Tax=Novosphingobium sp. JCM 18896 TaxID=2989731 RepID=UPI002221F544|nr:hypothetical protein [Novosphingobium sp. JCM 18896]
MVEFAGVGNTRQGPTVLLRTLAKSIQSRYAGLMPGPYHPLVEEWKTIAGTVEWSSPPASEDGAIDFNVPLDIGETTVAGLALRGKAYGHLPDMAVTFQLEVGQDGMRTRVPLIRLDWKPRSQWHQNPNKTRISGTHAHPFEANWLEGEQRMRRGNLPWAEKVAEFHAFSEVLDYAKNLFRINDIDLIPIPEWSSTLF